MSPELYVQMTLSAWKTHNTRLDDLLVKLTDGDLMQETAPGRNTGIYLLGHLTAVNDSLFKFLGIGERLHPELDAVFLEAPDRSGIEIPAVAELRNYWKEINTALYSVIDTLPVTEWFTRHTAVSEEDFKKEPHRNKLNIIINRTNHQAYHLGQFAYLLNKNK
jgi:hypothetical protein